MISATGFETYFIVISMASCIGLLWLVRRTEQAGLERNQALDIAMLLMVSGFLGGRMYHVLFEEPRYYLDDPSRVFEIWRGGFVWFGGAIAALVSGLTLLKWRRAPIGLWLDVCAPVAALVYALGRIACLLTGCCYGSVCTLIKGYSFRYPTQAFAVLWELGVIGVLLWLERQRERSGIWRWLQRNGQIFFIWLGLHSIGRIIMEAMRADPRGAEILGLSQATWISLGLLIYFVSQSVKRGRRCSRR